MAGLEFVGLALAIFPVCVEIVEFYSGSLTSRDVKHLLESLKSNELLFRNSIEFLLRSTVSPPELRLLLNDLNGDAWRNASLKQQVSQQLGPQAESLFGKVQDIYKIILELKKKLPDQGNDRFKRVVKYFVHGPSNKASLERLRVRISEFRELTQDSLKLASSHNNLPRALQDLACIRDCASGLHDALRTSWNCSCAALHPANIQLDAWTLCDKDKNEKDYLHFSLLFPHVASNAQHEHWVTAEVPVARLNCQGWPPPIIPSKLVSSPTASTTASSQIAPSIGSSITLAASQGSGSSPADKIDDLCAILKKPPDLATRLAPRRRLGSISDSSGRDYHISKDTQPLSTTTSGTLKDFFSSSRNLSNKIRVQLALKLAWAVLQVSSTGWLTGRWTKENVHLIMATPSESLAYITHGFESQASSPTQTSTLSPETINDIAAQWIRNTTLFALGVFMLEVCYMRSIEDLASDHEKGHGSEFLTAMRLCKVVHDELGLAYAQAVNACLTPDPVQEDDAQGRPKDYAKFAEGVWSRIISPLNTAAANFGA